MSNYKYDVLGKIVSNKPSVSIGQARAFLVNEFTDAYGIIEAVEQVFWCVIRDGEFIPMSDADPAQVDENNWLSVRLFNPQKEIRLSRNGNQFKVTVLSDKQFDLGNKKFYRDTQWLLYGERKTTSDFEQEMQEFQVNKYRMPLVEGSKAPVIKVRHYIDYEKDTGIAKIVAERFYDLGEEQNHG